MRARDVDIHIKTCKACSITSRLHLTSVHHHLSCIETSLVLHIKIDVKAGFCLISSAAFFMLTQKHMEVNRLLNVSFYWQAEMERALLQGERRAELDQVETELEIINQLQLKLNEVENATQKEKETVLTTNKCYKACFPVSSFYLVDSSFLPC